MQEARTGLATEEKPISVLALYSSVFAPVSVPIPPRHGWTQGAVLIEGECVYAYVQTAM